MGPHGPPKGPPKMLVGLSGGEKPYFPGVFWDFASKPLKKLVLETMVSLRSLKKYLGGLFQTQF